MLETLSLPFRPMTRQAANCGSLPGRKRENTRRRGLMGGRQPSRFPVRKGKTQTGRQAAQGAAAQHGEEGVPSPAEEGSPVTPRTKRVWTAIAPFSASPQRAGKAQGTQPGTVTMAWQRLLTAASFLSEKTPLSPKAQGRLKTRYHPDPAAGLPGGAQRPQEGHGR